MDESSTATVMPRSSDTALSNEEDERVFETSSALLQGEGEGDGGEGPGLGPASR